jgi:hypothetical protein
MRRLDAQDSFSTRFSRRRGGLPLSRLKNHLPYIGFSTVRPLCAPLVRATREHIQEHGVFYCHFTNTAFVLEGLGVYSTSWKLVVVDLLSGVSVRQGEYTCTQNEKGGR